MQQPPASTPSEELGYFADWYLPSSGDFSTARTALFSDPNWTASGDYVTSTAIHDLSHDKCITINAATGITSQNLRNATFNIRVIRDFIATSGSYIIGDLAGGGIIYNIFDNGDGTETYYVITKEDIATGIYGAYTHTLVGNTYATAKYGKMNSYIMLATYALWSETGGAAEICNSYSIAI